MLKEQLQNQCDELNARNLAPLWRPSKKRIAESNELDFINKVQIEYPEVKDHWSLYNWSIKNKQAFWKEIWRYFDVKGEQGELCLSEPENMLESQWFPQGQLNYTQNLLRRNDNGPALTEIDHKGRPNTLSYQELVDQVACVALFFKEACKIKPGDVIAGIFTNSIACSVCCLAAAKIGAVWTACSVDFGLQAILDRFEQVKPKLLCSTTQLSSVKKTAEFVAKIEDLFERLPSLQGFIDCAERPADIQLKCKTVRFHTVKSENVSRARHEEFEQFPFNHPLYVLYSSGTTGKPKCIVHGAGGTLLQHIKELALHSGLKNKERILFYSSCGWMMWNWQLSSLALGAHLFLYDGPLLFPKPSRLFDLVDEHDINILGLSPRYLQACEKADVAFGSAELSSLNTILSTGSVLSPYLYDYVYSSIKSDVLLSSISGGTDIISCFVLGSELLPVYSGEAQTPGLGMDVQAVNENGEAVIGQKGELVCKSSFVSKPIYFVDDPERKKYRAAYFEGFSGVWTHGDYVAHTERGGYVIYGRSDATLNPGGIRVGSAEIYRQLFAFDFINDAIAVDVQRDGQVEIVLFVQLEEGIELDTHMLRSIKQTLRTNLSENHVPSVILAAPDLPRTYSGKTVELAVKKILAGEPVKNANALINPESLAFFRKLELTL